MVGQTLKNCQLNSGRGTNPSLAKSVSVQPHDKNDRQTNGRKRTPNR